MWNRKEGVRGPVPLTSYEINETCPAPIFEDRPMHWGSAWNVEFTGPPAGVSCNFCHKTWVWRGGFLEPTYGDDVTNAVRVAKQATEE